jgi:hypothetical protein
MTKDRAHCSGFAPPRGLSRRKKKRALSFEKAVSILCAALVENAQSSA